MAETERTQPSAFAEQGLNAVLDQVKAEIQALYKDDEVPWVIGYSGGKDSTATLQLVWMALAELPTHERIKPVHVISTDTLVENPIVAAWVSRSLVSMQEAADDAALPIVAHRLTPAVANTFWVNLIGKGYPAPRNKFRWCTERLKIMPSNTFIRNVVRDNGEAILVLGTRKLESARRGHNMREKAKAAVRDRLTPNTALPNSLVYTPIEDWSNDDVWLFLMQTKNPWGYSNKDLMSMYRGATADGECPLVVDTSTPSCGNSRFGCWVCTLVDKDKSMGAMIQNDIEKEWMLPLLEFRNELDFRSDEDRLRDRGRRDFRRMTGRLSYYRNKDQELQLVPGPYTQSSRGYWLRRLLETQRWVQENGPADVRELELITMDELQEIRRIWVIDKHEIEDQLPEIYEETMGKPYPGARIDDHAVFDQEALDLLREVCDQSDLQYELVRNLLDTERRFRTMVNRRGLFKAIEQEIRRCYYEGEEDALAWVRDRYEANEATFVTDDGHEVYADGLLEEPPTEEVETIKPAQPFLYSVSLNET